MNRVTKRTWLMGAFIWVLVGGMVFFLFDYWVNAGSWVSAGGSPHVYSNTNLSVGTITDRSGTVLLDMTGERSYAENAATRKSTLHWLGDREGNISAAAVSHYAGAMVGFDPVNGIYNSGDSSGVTELTLSASVQNTALDAMGNRKGTVAVYNYKTGEILCALTTPTFDPEDAPNVAEDESGAWEGVYLNRFTQVTYTPGSIFKIVTTGAALEYVPDIQEKSFLCTGEIKYGEGENTAYVTCETGHGTMTLKSALANSCNCSFAQIAELIGKQNMVDYVKKLEVTEPVRFDGITTARGQYDLSQTAPVSFAWSCIGQHTNLINPARYMTLMGVIAGGGQAALPHMVARVTSGEEVTYEAETEKTDRLLSRETAETLKSYMRSNVKNVYGDWNFGGLNVCGKSGTSQLGGEQVSNALFSGFVADEEYPLAFVCVIENAGYGAANCVPVLGRVLTACKAVMDGR